uniref:Uncharacterized protein n=1 Tax=Roseihalotalea indica TaxID=2867963 RepID=A0AA49JHS9_9BACT|nr:hypothetical protein K4G66_12840 [Tunicatimonas sp. TK19036]
MNNEALEQALVQLVDKKIELSKIDYNDPQYDDLEEEIHDMEDDLLDKYGQFLEEVLADVHDELCPDDDVLLPTAYLANKYVKTEENGSVVYLPAEGGVIVDVDEYPNQLTRLVLVPGPTRLILQVGRKKEEEVWRLS